MTPQSKAKFEEHAKKESPREACALLIIKDGKEELILCRNISEVFDEFIIDPACYVFAEGEGDIVAVVHSHCYSQPMPSQADLVACEQTGMKWHIFAVQVEKWHEFAPKGYQAPLIGREWSHGILDCYSLIRDYYLRLRGIALPDFNREFEWWDKGFDLYKENFSKAGFYEVNQKDLMKDDIILMKVHSKVINHGAVYLGDDRMLHHLNGRLSSRDVYGGYYQKHTEKVVRFKS